MDRLYVVGGQQRRARSMSEGIDFWYKYDRGVVLEVDTVGGCVKRRAEYMSPPQVCTDDEPAILFKCGTLVGHHLYVSTQTEALVYRVPEMTLTGYVSLPCFNDVHHVRPSLDGNLLVAVSGLDLVVEVTLDGRIVREWSTDGGDPWERFSRRVDYRRIASLKPHRTHPNHIFYVGDEIWVTRFQMRDAICLTNPAKRITISSEHVHDGHLYGGSIFFTTVSGTVVIVDAETLKVNDVFDLNALGPPDTILGWCRGLLRDGDKLWIGFSRLRLTKFRENLSWVRHGFRRHLPTRIACYDLARRTLVGEIDLQRHGLDAVFSIFAVPESAALPEQRPLDTTEQVAASAE